MDRGAWADTCTGRKSGTRLSLAHTQGVPASSTLSSCSAGCGDWAAAAVFLALTLCTRNILFAQTWLTSAVNVRVPACVKLRLSVQCPLGA